MKRATLWSLVCAACAACAASSTPASRPTVPTELPGFPEHAYALQAEEARARALEAQAAGAPSMFESLQLRVRNLDRQGIDSQQGVGLGARFKLERPFSMTSVTESLRRQGQSARFELETARAEAEALVCAESVRAHAQLTRDELDDAQREKLLATLSWIDALSEASEVDAVSAARATLSARRALVAAASAQRPARRHDALGTLPDVREARQGVLDGDPARLLASIEASHPSVHAHLAAQQRYLAEQSTEQRNRAPWLDFFELGYGTRSSGLDGLSARLAVAVPLDDGARGRSKKAGLLAQSEAYRSLAQAYTLARGASAALSELSAIEQHAVDYEALSDAAASAEQLANLLLAEHRGTPDKVAQLLDDAHAARLDILAASERAGQAACTLKFSTGVSYASWPRK